MPRAVILNTASKAATAGGTFADTLAANSGDSLAVATYDTGGAHIVEMWGIDSDSVAELQVIYTRPEATHDQSHGFRVEIPSLVPGGAANVAAHNLLVGYADIQVYRGDVGLFQVTSTAADDVAVSWLTDYDDLPGISGIFANWDQVKALRKSTVGINCLPVASATPGAYGASRALNTDDDRLHADTWYALLGVSVQIPVTTISFKGPGWGGARLGLPAGVLDMRSDMWFVDQTIKRGVPLIPCFNANDKGNILLEVVDGEASTSPKVDVLLYELTAKPGV